MASELDPDGNQAPPRLSSLRPPPKPVRPRAPVVLEEDGPTTRMSLAETVDAVRRATEAAASTSVPGPVGAGSTSAPAPVGAASTSAPAPVAVPPPLPASADARVQTAALSLEAPYNPAPAGHAAPRERLAKIALAIFALGVLVGVGGSALVMTNRTPRATEVPAPRLLDAAAPPASAPHDPPKPPSLATRAVAGKGLIAGDGLATKAPAVEPSGRRAAAAKAEEKNPAVAETQEPTRETSPLPVPSSDAQSCQELTGDSRPKSASAKSADRETRVANRQLMLGNVEKAQIAYCKALAWDRSNIDRRVNLARLFLVRRDWKKAAEYGLSALELDAKNRAALAVVGDAWAALGKTEKARAAWLAAEGKTNASVRQLDLIVRRNMALAKRVEHLKDLLLAERLYRRVLLLQPEHVGATKGIASCLLKAGNYQAAEAWARRAEVVERGKQGRTG